MKFLIILSLLVSCGKGADGKKVPAPVNSLSIQDPHVEMVMTVCLNDHDCTEVCSASYIACVEPCGGQNTSNQFLLQNPELRVCQERCQREVNACYNSPKEITKEAWSLLTGPT
jgi:hypothetical protein